MNALSSCNERIERWRAIQAKIARAAKGRCIRLVLVSKTFDANAIAQLYAVGQRDFGENYVQEWRDKALLLKPVCPDIIWHFIGHLQTNKSRLAAQSADWVQSVDSIKLAQRLNAQRPEHLAPLNVCLEVNIGAEPQKSGLTRAQLRPALEAIAAMPRLRVRGLMCVPNPHQDVARQFAAMREEFLALQAAGWALDTLSMGMSADFESAIEHGATLVRVGSAIFGARVQAA